MILFIVLWLLSGVLSFLFWWRKDHRLSLLALVPLISGALTGPISFVIGWSIHGGGKNKHKYPREDKYSYED